MIYKKKKTLNYFIFFILNRLLNNNTISGSIPSELGNISGLDKL